MVTRACDLLRGLSTIDQHGSTLWLLHPCHRTCLLHVHTISSSLSKKYFAVYTWILGSAPDGQPSKKRTMRCNELPLVLPAGSACGLGIDLFGIHIISLAGQFRTASNSNTLAGSLAGDPCSSWIRKCLPSRPHRSGLKKVCDDVDGSQHHGSLWICASPGSCWQNCGLSQQLNTRRLPRPCIATRSKKNAMFLIRSLHVPPQSWDRRANTSWPKSCRWFVVQHVPPAVDEHWNSQWPFKRHVHGTAIPHGRRRRRV